MTDRPSLSMRNLGKPIQLVGVNFCGVSAEASRENQEVKLWTRLSLTSDDHLFHRIVENLGSAVTHLARQAGSPVNLGRAETVLLVIRPDDTAELWLDAAAVSIEIMTKRAIQAGSIVFERDIADITGMSFPLVEIGPKDRLLCIFRLDWQFGLFFDFNPDGALNLQLAYRSLGTLYRRLKYRHTYQAVANEQVFSSLIKSGWFPFVEIMGSEFKQLADCCEAGFELVDEEEKLVAKFTEERVHRMLNRWTAKAHFASKTALLRSATNAFLAGDPIATIKITLTEIEGVLAEAHKHSYGTSARRRTLLEFAVASAERKAGASDTLLLSAAFARYLANYTFASFDSERGAGSAGSRHAVGHGVAATESYTLTRALQALLTLDQLAFYT